MSTVIQVQSLSKRYRIGLKEKKHDTFIGQLGGLLRAPIDNYKKLRSLSRFGAEDESVFWALRDINFEVQEGEVLGIIGHNGAGKSTLLKILSRITEPSAGQVRLKGRVSALLEVGTGFHPELTGRENIYMNGTILGMTRREIDRKLDEIIDFSGVEQYIDTPVKFYSSGMRVRLAFSVAAHLEPEILIIDEVLAVGDAEFQKKCLGKMKDVSGEGRTVLFVSHNMAAVKTLCGRAIVLEHGLVSKIDEVDKSVAHYLGGHQGSLNNRKFDKVVNSEDFILHEISLKGQGHNGDEPLSEDMVIELMTEITIKNGAADRFHITYHLNNELGEPLFSLTHADSLKLQTGRNQLVCTFPKAFFQSGTFYLTLLIVKDRKSAFFVERDIMSFLIVDGSRELGEYMGREPGYIKPSFLWINKATK